MNVVQIRQLGDQQLVHEELRLERVLIHARFALKTGQLEDTSQLNKIRKDIARLRTVQGEREREQGAASDSLREKYRSSFDPDAQPVEAAAAGAESKGFLKGIVDKVTGKE
jgi:large subunit ribosomal protein L29